MFELVVVLGSQVYGLLMDYQLGIDWVQVVVLVKDYDHADEEHTRHYEEHISVVIFEPESYHVRHEFIREPYTLQIVNRAITMIRWRFVLENHLARPVMKMVAIAKRNTTMICTNWNTNSVDSGEQLA